MQGPKRLHRQAEKIMADTHCTMYAILAQQTERTRGSSTSQIKQLIAESDSKIILLENEMAALESRMAALVELRDLECAARDALRFLTAPIRTLPVELLAEIFLLSIREPDESGYIYSKLLHIQDAFRISHVCRRWRQIANGTPQLWAGPVKVDFRQQRSLTEEGINGLEMLLARSAPLTVPVTIIGLENGSRPTESSCRATETLLCTAARWRSLRFVNYMVPPWFFQRLAGRSLDCLEELVLWNVDQDSHFDPTTVSSFATAPRLRKATLSSTCGIPMPWAQLRDITLAERISPESFRSIFSQCIDVLKVCVRVVGTSVLSQIRPDALALNQLRILSVTWVGDESGMQFFDCLSAPALDELHLCFEEGDIDWAEDAFTAFQLRSPNITKLKIEGEGFPVPSHALITAFRHAPFLTHFSIDHCPNSVDDHFCQALCYTDDAEPLVPRLHTLAVAETDGKFSQDGLANMIASRWWTDTELASRSRPPAVARWKQIRLKEDWIGSSFEFSSTFRGTIYALQETGLDFDFVELEYWKLDW